MALLAPPDHAEEYLNIIALDTVEDDDYLAVLKQLLQQAEEKINADFYRWHNITRLVKTRAWLVEQFVLELWLRCDLHHHDLTLVAVGGFGRGDLQPFSDVDLLILFDQVLPEEAVSLFIQNLWDLGLDVGHAVRTVAETVQLAAQNIVVATNLMESRFLRGNPKLYRDMMTLTGDQRMWSGRDFFQAKYAEQQERHRKCGGSAYNLEPNIKEGPGGLRDIQMVTWVAQRHFHVQSMHGLVDVGFLHPDEYIRLQKGLRKLWKIRFALHLLAGRKEDRLLFDYQKQLAVVFGYQDDDESLGVEKFMQNYYRNAMYLEQLNMRLLQLFKENILQGDEDKQVTLINDEFSIINGFLEVNDRQVFLDRPAALFELFHHYQQNPNVYGIRANTQRYVSMSLHLINDEFRHDESVKAIFLAIFKHKNLVFNQLNLMNALGVLGQFLPVFGRIVGRMQYDLFHMYTVDQHTLFVVRNIRQIFLNDEVHPLAHKVADQFKRPYVLHLAGFFHDIGKGRGGDHSEIGAGEARLFAEEFKLPKADGQLLEWLVRHHLVMSVVAQKQDINDPAVIQRFAELVRRQRYLDALYILTIADIEGTDPKLWNSYKDSLLSELYLRTTVHLDSSQQADAVAQGKSEARELISEAQIPAIESLWQKIPERFFDYATPEQVAAVSMAIVANLGRDTVCVTDRHDDGFEVMLYGENQLGLFHQVVEVFSNHHISVVNARIFSGSDGRILDHFHCLGEYDQELLTHIEAALLTALKTPVKEIRKRDMVATRRERLFIEMPEITFTRGRDDSETRVDVKCSDHDGLLVNLTRIFVSHGIDMQAAKIATFGNRAEDVFWLSVNQKALPVKLQQTIAAEFKSLLSDLSADSH
ncbi:bifunctional uridylyltransferase/uridylyl-removing enzyme [Marinicella pacifica]|uniref:Bifunctional uridylyltransferase/uridylyl-removing enzyme n=1 Tax=Marinicella pacifica TaxID=1171543 RepID=A0A917FPU0_9GAMM|nr:[protein-PII] uridylyltransferase [Marinicella pacifica]GGF95238.1 bifunctional uridylyltransferase/uridylyl-removing enzyme [Marinicella pacifica]